MASSQSRWRWFASVVSVVALVLGAIATAAPASASPAMPTGLTPNGEPISGSPVLTWTAVSDATSYNVEMSTSATFDTNPIFSATTTNRRATPTSVLPTGTVFWRVRSVNSTGFSDWALGSLENPAKAGPNPVTPLDGATLEQPADPPLLTWDPVPGATGYEIEIDGTQSSFVNKSVYTTKTPSFVVPDPQENGTYAWHVRATLGPGVTTLWSQDQTYNIGPLPVVTGAVSPVNDPVLGNVDDVVFDWEAVPGAVSYDLQVDDDDSFSAPIDTQVVKGTRYSPPTTYDNNQYWWRVRARNIFGKAQEWTEVPIRQFRRSWPDAPKLLHPANNQTSGDDLYYQWTAVPHASRYRLEIGSDPNFSPGTYSWCYTTETTYTPGFTNYSGLNMPSVPQDNCMADIGKPSYWRVQALDGPRGPEVNGIYSAIQSFFYDPGQVRQTWPVRNPASGALPTVDVPTLQWDPAQDAVAYEVHLSWNGGQTTGTTNSYSWTSTVKLDATKGPFEWTVRAIDKDGGKSDIPIVGEKFNVSGNIPATGADALTPLAPSPDASPSSRFPTLKWEPMSGATFYKIYVAPAGGSYQPLSANFLYPEGSDTSATYLKPGTYNWFVVAYNSSGSLGTGPAASFQISDLGSVAGQELALHGSGIDTPGSTCNYALTGQTGQQICTAMTGTPVLDWDPVPDAGYYMIYLSRDREFTNMVWGSKNGMYTIPTTQNTRWDPASALPDSQAGDAYYWFVRPCKAPGACAPDPLSATHAFDKRSNAIEQLEPSEGADVDSAAAKDVTFTWRDYLATNQDTRFADPITHEQSSQAARGYHLQVGTTSAFTTVIDDVTVDQRTYTPYNKTYPEGTLYWRIQPVDGAGNKLTWSAARPFHRSSPTVTLVSPVDGDVATSTQPFRWEPIDFAASYDIEVYKNADVTASSTNRVLSANSKQVAYTLATPLPPSENDYIWRVRRVDIDGRKAGWSSWRHFKVAGGMPELLTPAASATVDGRDSLFTWTTVPRAAAYKFERRADGSTSLVEAVTTANLAYAPRGTITVGTWQWRVTALDPAGVVLGTSAWRSFSVPSTTTPTPTPTPSPTPPPDTTRPKVVYKSPTSTARRTANFIAKFSEPVKGVSRKTMRLYRKGSSTPLAAVVTLSSDGRTAKLNPNRNLRARKYYILRLTSGIRDRSGNTLRATSWTVRAK